MSEKFNEIIKILYGNFLNFLKSPVKSFIKLSFLVLILVILLQLLYFYAWPEGDKIKTEECPDTTIESILYGKAFRNDCRTVFNRILPQKEAMTNSPRSSKAEQAKGQQPENGNNNPQVNNINSNILDHTGNILNNASLLIAIISFVVFLATLVAGFLGYKWLKEYHELKKSAEQNKRNILDSAIMTLCAIPALSNSIQHVPESLIKLICRIKDIFNDHELVELIDKNPKQFEELRFVYALYFIATNDHSIAIKTLEQINEKAGIDDDLKLKIRYRLGIEYRSIGYRSQKDKDYDKSIKMFESIQISTQNAWHKKFGISVTKFVKLRRDYIEKHENRDHRSFTTFLELRSQNGGNGDNFRDFKNNQKILSNELFDNFKELSETYKHNISIQFLGVEFAAFILLLNFLPDKETELADFFSKSFIESSRLTEKQIGLTFNNNIECIWNYAYAYILAQAHVLIERGLVSEDKINNYYDKDQILRKVLDYSEQSILFMPTTNTFFSEMGQCAVDKSEFVDEIQNFLNVLEQDVFPDEQGDIIKIKNKIK